MVLGVLGIIRMVLGMVLGVALGVRGMLPVPLGWLWWSWG